MAYREAGAAGAVLALFLALLLVHRLTRGVEKKCVAVVVVGDVGRSPRMCYHATSLVQHGWKVRVVGYFDTRLPPTLEGKVECVSLYNPPAFVARLPRALFALVALIKVPLVALSLFHALAGRASAPEVVVVQTPPAIPSLLVARIACVLRGSRLVIDWHNLGYTILGLKLGASSKLVRLAERLERWSGRRADAHLFVTQGMRDVLVKSWGLQGTPRVLYDRPGQHFCPVTLQERGKLLTRLADEIGDEGLRSGHAIVVTSTSWTPDEDMDMLLNAMSKYEELARNPRADLPAISLLITGKGPLRDTYKAKFAARAEAEKWAKVSVNTAWLAAEDYPRLLSVADLGISLHSSSSGLDLPMKVVDMLGSGLLVCALDFPCLKELIQPRVNGEVFQDSNGLAQAMMRLLQGFPNEHEAGDFAGNFLTGPTPRTWNENWDQVVLPLLPS